MWKRYFLLLRRKAQYDWNKSEFTPPGTTICANDTNTNRAPHWFYGYSYKDVVEHAPRIYAMYYMYEANVKSSLLFNIKEMKLCTYCKNA